MDVLKNIARFLNTICSDITWVREKKQVHLSKFICGFRTCDIGPYSGLGWISLIFCFWGAYFSSSLKIIGIVCPNLGTKYTAFCFTIILKMFVHLSLVSIINVQDCSCDESVMKIKNFSQFSYKIPFQLFV